MSLVAHYPLMGNTNDYSGNNYHGVNYGATISSGGKIGQCYSFGSGTTQRIEVPLANIINPSFFTVSFWMKADESIEYNTNEERIITVRRAETGTWWSIAFQRAKDEYSAGSGLDFYYYNGSTVITKGLPSMSKGYWTHVIVTVWDNKINFSVDGGEFNPIYNDVPIAKVNNYQDLVIGNFGGATVRPFLGWLNDIRVFDHQLSTKEKSELYNTKMLHYSFDDCEEPTTNIFPRAYNVAAWTSAFNGSAYGFGSGTNIQQIATISTSFQSFITKVSRINSGVSQSDYVAIDLSSPLNSTRTISFWYFGSYGATITPYNNDGSANLYYLDANNVWQGGNTSIAIPVILNTWQKITVKIVNKGVAAGTGWSWTILHSNNNLATLANTEHWSFAEFQYEEKNHATPYTLNSRIGEIFDYSLFKNHAILNEGTTPQWIADSKIGGGCYKFNGQHIQINSPPVFKSTDYWTFSMWLKIPSGLDNNWRNFITNINGDDTSSTWLFHNGTQLTFYQDFYSTPYIWYSGLYLGNQLPYDTWFHLLVTNTPYNAFYSKNSTIKVYINGQQLVSQTCVWSPRFTDPTIEFGRIGSSGNRAFIGDVDDFRLYPVVLYDKDIVGLYNNRASLDNGGNLWCNQLKENLSWDDAIQNTNLVRNGCGEYGNNTNFSALQYDSAESCFYLTSGSTTWLSTDYIPILGNGLDKFDQYQLEAYFKQPTGTMGRYYFMMACYDKDKNFIEYSYSYKRSGTEALLSQPLNNGDLYMYVDNLTNWYMDSSPTVFSHLKQFKLFPSDHQYPDYTYSRIIGRYLDRDVATGKITLQAAWAGGSFPVGTPVCNTNDGGGYSYIAAGNALMTTDWTYRNGISSSTESSDSMRVGTKYVKIGALFNRDAGTVTGYIKNIKFFNITNPGQSQVFIDGVQNLNENGILSHQQISEIGVAESLIGYYPLDGDYEDYAGNMNDASATGTTFVGGIANLGCSFVNSTDKLTISPVTDKILTLSVWHKWDTTSTNWRTIFANSANIHHMIFNNNRSIGVYDGTFRTFGASGVSPDNEWHNYVMIIVNKKNAKLYIDGNYVGMTYSTIDLDAYPITNIGGWGSYGCGYLDEVRIYNRILTPDEIAINYDLYNPNGSQMKLTKDCFYTKGQIKEGY